MKKFVYSIVSIIWVWIWFVWAQSISFQPEWDWVFWYGCTVPIDVYVNTMWQEIAAMDLVIDSSMDYVDFVPSDYIPYFLKPIVNDKWLIHIAWFTLDSSERLHWEWMVGTLYFKPKIWDIDGIVKLYFLWEWNTNDTNLSIAWGVDVLKDIWQAVVSFSDALPSCITENINNTSDSLDNVESDLEIVWWFSNLTYDEVLENTIKTIDEKYWNDLSKKDYKCFLMIWFCIVILIIFILLLKRKNNKWNKNIKK